MTIADNLARVRQQMDRAAARAGRKTEDVTLVAVSKVHPAEAIREAHEAGQRHFGESYVQEFLAKQKELEDLPDLRWHFIGHLQRNKARKIVNRLFLLETVDSIPLINELSRRAVTEGTEIDLLLQVKLSRETTKSGCAPEALDELVGAAREAPGVTPRGLMVIPPFELSAEEGRAWFRELRELRDRRTDARDLKELSMGMSHDFEVAIEEGSTLVRVGTAIFGTRHR